MDPQRKRRMFDALVKMGFKEIEVGFPSASQPDFDFVPPAHRGGPDPRRRHHPGAGAVPPGADRAHLRVPAGRARGPSCTSTTPPTRCSARWCSAWTSRASSTSRSTAPSCAEARGDGARHRRSATSTRPRASPLTEPEYAIEICHAVMDVIEPTPERPLILNLPATVECYTPNVYGDVIEWFGRHIRNRDQRAHQPAPAQRPRHRRRPPPSWACWPAPTASRARCSATASAPATSTSSTWRINLFINGVDPELDITDIDALRRIAEYCNRLPVHPRHPYVGDLVYTAFSGSHQDAIKKGFEALDRSADGQRRRVRGLGRAVPAARPEAPRPHATRPSSASTASAARAAWPTS